MNTRRQWVEMANEAIADAAEWKAQCRELQAQRDALVAALRDLIAASWSELSGQPIVPSTNAVARARAALAAVSE